MESPLKRGHRVSIDMAFVVSVSRLAQVRRSSSRPLSPRRRSRRVSVSANKRLTVVCGMGDRPPSETSYLLDDSISKTPSEASPMTLGPDIEKGGVGHDGSDDRPEAPAPVPGIVQTSADLDGKVLFGEFLSTFIFVYLSVNASASGSPLANSLNNAAVIAAVAASFMPVSGAHLNPAVTLALAVTNRVSLKRGIAFIPLQLAAAVAASYLAWSLGTPVSFAGLAASATATDLVRAFFAELMPMFIIVIVVFQTAVATEREGGVGNKLAALYIGLAVLACVGTFTSGVFNPARAFGPALVTRNFSNHWVFWVGPFVGACLAAFVRFCYRQAICCM